MADLFVKHTGSNTSPYETWAKAATTLGTAVTAAGAGDSIYVADDHSETLAVDTTYTTAAGVRIICVSDAGGGSSIGALATTALIDGSGTSGVDISTAGGPVYIYGIHFKTGGSTGSGGIFLSSTASDVTTAESCTFEIPNTNGSSAVTFGASTQGGQNLCYVTTINCTYTWGATTQGLYVRTQWESIGDDFVGGATVPATLIEVNDGAFGHVSISGADLSDLAGTLVIGSRGPGDVHFWGCKLHASVTPLGTTSVGAANVWLHDCNSGDVHYSFAHYNHFGSTVAGNSIYPTGGAKYDGTNSVSWTVDGNANATKASPYLTPWIDVYHAGTSAITPYLESVRDGSATKYNDDEVWSEWMFKATASSTRATFSSERTIAGTASALESSSLGASDWTGEGGTAAFMKLRPDASFTPAEVGHIRARIGVSGDYTIIVDPFIRGLS